MGPSPTLWVEGWIMYEIDGPDDFFLDLALALAPHAFLAFTSGQSTACIVPRIQHQ